MLCKLRSHTGGGGRGAVSSPSQPGSLGVSGLALSWLGTTTATQYETQTVNLCRGKWTACITVATRMRHSLKYFERHNLLLIYKSGYKCYSLEQTWGPTNQFYGTMQVWWVGPNTVEYVSLPTIATKTNNGDSCAYRHMNSSECTQRCT